MGKWRLIDTGRRTAAENMCLDEAMLKARGQGLVPNTLRFLQFRPHCVLVGFHQSVDQEIRTAYCQEAGIDINRRITGGGAIYFGEDALGWEIIAGKDVASRDILTLYRTLCAAAIEGLRLLGVEAAFRPVNDIEVRGRKISGTGGTEAHDAFLFQGTLLVDLDLPVMLRALRIPTEKLKDKEIDSIRERMTCLRWELGHLPPMAAIKAAMAKGIAKKFGIELEAAALSAWEQQYLQDHLPHFKSPDWIHKERPDAGDDHFLYSACKTPGGLIRIAVKVDDRRNCIKMILVTGDFFVYPKRAILDLEARLKNCKIKNIAATVHAFFQETRAVMPGVGPEDFVAAIHEALRRRGLTRLGLSIEEANNVYLVNDALDRLPEAAAMLLPYCAKLASCDLRYQKGCTSCGGCTVGVAYELARSHAMEPITIVNFEDLQHTLHDLRQRGVKAYLGCCCDPFFVKHREDFEKAGMAGLLINVESTTCYDLNREQEAKAGKFSGETQLNLAILEKIVANGR